MTVQSKPFGMDLSPAAQKRHAMVTDSYERLQHLAFRAQSVHDLKNDEVVVVCIKVDTEWRPVVDALMPGANWQQHRDLGLEPAARGTAKFPICEVIAEKLPGIADALMKKPKKGLYKCIVLDEGGGTVYEIEPKEEAK